MPHAPQIAGRVTAMSEPGTMAYPSVGLNLNYKQPSGGTEGKRGVAERGDGDERGTKEKGMSRWPV